MIFESLPNDYDAIDALGKYHSYRKFGELNSEFDNYSAKILDLKNQKDKGLYFFFNLLNPMLASKFAIVIVPSHDPSTSMSGIKKLAIMLSKLEGRIDATDCLIRHTKVEKSATGGSRNIEKHLNSIKANNINLVKGKEILLLDDVTTTHCSLKACKQILINAGATNIVAYALAQTV